MPLHTKTELNALLKRAGIDARTAQAAMDIDGMLQQWRRRAMKREIGHRALMDLRIGIDLAQFDVLVAIAGPEPEFGEVVGETMVASVAERLNIDPSRASRLVSEMVDAGYARRAISQADGRRAIVELTEQGRAVVDAVRAYKFLVMGDFLAQWPAEEVAQFVPLLKKFANWSDGIDASVHKFADEIDALSPGPAETASVA